MPEAVDEARVAELWVWLNREHGDRCVSIFPNMHIPKSTRIFLHIYMQTNKNTQLKHPLAHPGVLAAKVRDFGSNLLKWA